MTTIAEGAAYQLYLGDCLDVMRGMEPGSIDLTVTSPPYDDLRQYNGYTFDFHGIAKELYRVTRAGGIVVWVVSDQTRNGCESLTSFRQALYFVDVCGFNMHDTMIYKVCGTGAKGSNKSYWQAFGYMFVLSKGEPKSINLLRDKPNRYAGGVVKSGEKTNALGFRTSPDEGRVIPSFGTRENVWDIHAGNNGDDQTAHPAPFPEALARDHILTWSNPGDLVLDPFLGSGTTGKMALQNGRRFVGCEISAEYLGIARSRVSQAAAQPLLIAPASPRPQQTSLI